MVKNLLASAGDAGEVNSIPGLGISLGVGNGNHSSILDGKIPWTEEPSGLQSMGYKELDKTETKHSTLDILHNIFFYTVF